MLQIFESALELQSETVVGSFSMGAPSGKKAGPPPIVKKLLGLFGSGREEDRLSGYLSFLKFGPQLLKFLPGKKAQDLKHWCASRVVGIICLATKIMCLARKPGKKAQDFKHGCASHVESCALQGKLARWLRISSTGAPTSNHN